jgi:hypothetical protein
MPKTAAFIDELRSAFGTEYIDKIMQAGVRGAPVFYAKEGEYELGTKVEHGVRVGTNARGNRCLLDGPMPGERQEKEISKFEARERREKLKGAR